MMRPVDNDRQDFFHNNIINPFKKKISIARCIAKLNVEQQQS